MNKLEVIARAISNVKHALICGHIMPDGDCLGSVLALAMILRQLGKQATVAGPDPIPEIYEFLPGIQDYRVGSPPEGAYDTLIALDCPVTERLGSGYRDLPGRDLTVINIDHHASTNSYGTYRYIDPQAAAVGEIIFDLLQLMKVNISLDMAICLYTAIVTDTGSFQYESTTPNTHRRAAHLIEMGVPFSRINVLLYEEKSRVSQLLLSAALKTLSFSDCGRVAWMIITRDMLRDTGAKDEHTEGIVNYARSIKGVEVGLLFHELPDGKYKISFRSKKTVDVNRLASFLGGGGHLRAAGCEIAGKISTIEKEVVAAAVHAAGGAGL
ncbi:bifunctional oligoribonuclease/PAP phosphatase NrnA [Pelotomaculum terephthalicicum JT]|uniref:DHH family phosphoesterase n=1 Tax=Pelotomaculum TaxID=191373 RepID=UPI0009D5E2F1|nr:MULTISPECIES: bifunctional oligoribonuclease/PAP phosphatase NrnA [Pelotomaculum]MCG9967763.1 bifunctional oligoribonuclease/PAP phosphatase NrnA [Pelotomaculum terephthalicicum JT]OPX85381.1 MAG: Bifunctional oligoribonuclease and PAP phosphatase NrnA [Pelotomaculum sp. PtaB.Bin117]OPY62686.1 MAG: Bifunctional oligoribonuclease and PAP phosphatase NrnA [Pelotomaculum sp. PtaU1.Bin065]